MPDRHPDSLPSRGDAVLCLPPAPTELSGPVKAWRQDVEILTYLPGKPDLNPMFLEKRVYQGSSGRVYPLPFIDRIAVEPEKRFWQALHIENDFLRLMILPEIGGRIHIGYDKTSGYDFFYRQNVIKPALVGLAGPWASGGVEFNWPQHHRPTTFMPVETDIEVSPDGSMTLWCSDHDPMLRMKGMHGVCLRPGSAALELRVRLFNRTPFTQTFLWWANAAARVHEQYQSFFPGDVRYVADHARRAISTFPLSDGVYYGVNYGDRAQNGVPDDEKPRHFVPDGSYPSNDLSWYANIPVPTSYMVTGTEEDFCGGYDHRAAVGLVHVANHHIAPGKKQWTWGNHEFGYAWDRNLTDQDVPYIELMGGVYTDNQPDFSWLAPWETRTFTQRWYAIRTIGIPQAANDRAALSLTVESGVARIGLEATRAFGSATIALSSAGREIGRWTQDLSASKPVILHAPLPPDAQPDALAVTVTAPSGVVIEYDRTRLQPATQPTVAQEPPEPEKVESVEELFLIGLHLEQYRHATRRPELYWQEGLRRDPGESRLHNALGLWRLRRGEFAQAADHFEAAIARLTRMNPNPRDGESYYNLGLARRWMGEDKRAYDAFYKSTWTAAWRAPAFFALAEIDASRSDWLSAREHAERSLRSDADNLNARNLLALALERLGEPDAAAAMVEETLHLDPLDIGARWRKGIAPADGQQCLDLTFDLLRAGQREEALRVLSSADPNAGDGSAPMILLTIAHVETALGRAEAQASYAHAAAAPTAYCFPSRLEELVVLQSAIAAQKDLWIAHYLLGNLLYDKRRHEEAIAAWEVAARRNPAFSIPHRNLGIAYLNIRNNPAQAVASFNRALAANPEDARLLYERDQLWKRVGEGPEKRLQELLRHPQLLSRRDDLSVELATLYNQTGQPDAALDLLLKRKYQPWEGGEGLVLGQYVRARLLLGRRNLVEGQPDAALAQFLAALEIPENLSEARHLLANSGDICYWLGEAYDRLGRKDDAATWWSRAARQKGDFQQMAVRDLSDMTFWTALAWQRLGRKPEAEALFHRLHDFSVELEHAEPRIDYFATSLPTMLLFDDDLRRRNRIDALFLRAQAATGLGRMPAARELLHEVLTLDKSHVGAADLLHHLGKSMEPAGVP
jgi:tetratricopeptide (TPR) repeat protein